MTIKNKKTINFLADVIAPLGVILVTILIFLIFMPQEPGILYWSDMVYTIWLEVLLFSYIIWLPRHGESVALKWMGSLYTMGYIGISVVWMIVFGLWLYPSWTIKVYFSVIAALFVLWLLICALSLKAENSYESSKDTLSNNRSQLDQVITTAEMLSQQFSLLASTRPELNTIKPSINALCRGLKTLSPTAMADPNASRRVTAICSHLEDNLTRINMDMSVAQIKEFADQSLIILNTIKNSIRK